MKHISITICFIIYSIVTFAQLRISENSGFPEFDTKTQIKELLVNYFNSSPDSTYNNPYWTEIEKQSYKHFDFLSKELRPSIYMGLPVHILQIDQVKDSLYKAKVMFYGVQKDNTPYVLGIFNYMIDINKKKLSNALFYNREYWNKFEVGMIDYYVSPKIAFNNKEAKIMLRQSQNLCNYFDKPMKKVEYYFADNYEEVLRVKGIDFLYGAGGSKKPTGTAFQGKIFCSGQNETYGHEIFHILIDPHFVNKHYYVSEGMACLLFGSRGKPLNWHLQRAHHHLKEHPEIDLSDFFNLYAIDEYTSYPYIIGGLFCWLIYEEHGKEGLLQLMNSGKSDMEYQRHIIKTLRLEGKDLNKYIRKKIEEKSQRTQNVLRQQILDS
ncbi:hypothetical protein [Marinifilum caeruleilacunae]|uniref:Peptidase MA-like domain-containing protein n=1 Tax=Marinifilum caeruleilacunae TaxID=2499076 RepID=A0ABX1WRZ9_9BACT|nr:hypothetical protein [Marinifilum caeruleilacunae]NOU58874.1 hypothetical protein [Marinifilum caeruleilacunae]